MHYSSYGDFGYTQGTANTWCDQAYPAGTFGAAVNNKCKEMKGCLPLVGCPDAAAPWTLVGRTLRGLASTQPLTKAEQVAVVSPPPAAVPTGSSGGQIIYPHIFQAPVDAAKKVPTWAWAAGGLAVAGLAAAVVLGRAPRRAVAGYGSYSRRKRRSRKSRR